MSDIEPVRGVEYTFASFLWREIFIIREVQRAGHYYTALQYALDLVDYLPEAFQKGLKFHDKAIQIREELEDAIAKAVGSHDMETKRLRSKIGPAKARTLLKGFLGELCTMLDKRGYLEKPSTRLKSADFKGLEKNED